MIGQSQWNKPPRAQQSCGTCNAWLPNPQANPKSGEPRQGWCRAMPPTLVQTTITAGSALDVGGPRTLPALQGVQPPQSSAGWCRAFEPIEDDDDRTESAS